MLALVANSLRSFRSSATGALSGGGAPRPVHGRSKTVGGGNFRFGDSAITSACRRLACGSRKTERGSGRIRRIVSTFNSGGLLAQCFRTAQGYVRRLSSPGSGSVANRSSTRPTRLETRTKESNTCASQGLARKPPWRNEGEGRPRRRPRWDPEASPSPPRAHHRPVSPAAPGRWSMSARVRTRKMVNYAWAGRSQRKLWWRSVAVLTCKSVVRPGYRGERLIEPSSSWFPPKFPSG